MDIYEAAVQELEAIEAQIKPLLARREELRQFVELGRKLFVQGSYAVSTDVGQGVQIEALGSVADAAPRRVRRSTSTKDQIIRCAQQAIATAGPRKTADIIALLEADGVEIGGSDKTLTVSSVLSRAKDIFKSDRAAGGWTLVSPHKEETPQGAPTPAGS